jgi:hypothetical protein
VPLAEYKVLLLSLRPFRYPIALKCAKYDNLSIFAQGCGEAAVRRGSVRAVKTVGVLCLPIFGLNILSIDHQAKSI